MRVFKSNSHVSARYPFCASPPNSTSTPFFVSHTMRLFILGDGCVPAGSSRHSF